MQNLMFKKCDVYCVNIVKIIIIALHPLTLAAAIWVQL